MEDKKTHKFPKKWTKKPRSNDVIKYVITPRLIQVISNTGIGEETPKKMINYDF